MGATSRTMPIVIVDSNFLQKPALSEYLSASRSNKIAVAEEVLVEMHKREPALTVRKNLEVARGYPTQVIILRGVTSIYGLSINSAADARKLIDRRQTTGFAQWYDDVLQASNDCAISRSLANAKKQAQAQTQEIAAKVQHMLPIFRDIKKRFSNEELTQLRKRIPYGASTQCKLLDIMYGISRALFINTNVSEHQYPELKLHAVRYFIFRYAMCMTLLYTRWVHHGNLSEDTAKLVNHVVDMHLAALGTFFGGVVSDDEMLVDVHREARWILRATGNAFVG